VNREYQVAGLMAVTAMFTLAGYEFVRSAATVLFKQAYGAENLPLVMAAMPFVVFGAVWVYGHLLTKLGPRRTLLVTTIGSSMLMVCCFVLLKTGSKAVTPVLFLIKEVYIVLLIEQYWSYINSSVTPATARRVNGPVVGIAGIGSTIGGFSVGMSAEQFGTDTMVLIGALAVLPAALLAHVTYTIHGEPEAPPLTDGKVSHMGWRWFKENPTLLYLLLIVLSTQVVAAVLDFKFQGLLSVEFAGRSDEETAFQGWFWGSLGTSGLVLQFLITPLLLSLVSLRLIHIMMPLIHITAITVALIEPSVLTVGIALFLFKAFDYSIFRAAKEVLYVPLSFDERYRAKEVIDVFGYRTGKGGSSVVIVFLQKMGVAMSNYYLIAGFIAAAVWLALIFPLTRHAKATQEEQEQTKDIV
jgi:ATP:ADP antiporter, AAA family